MSEINRRHFICDACGKKVVESIDVDLPIQWVRILIGQSTEHGELIDRYAVQLDACCAHCLKTITKTISGLDLTPPELDEEEDDDADDGWWK